MIRKDYGDIIALYLDGKIGQRTPKEVVDKLLETSDTLYKKYTTCQFIGKHRFNVGDSFMRPWTNNNSILTIVRIDYQAREYICHSSLFPEPTIRVSFSDDYRLQPVYGYICPCCKVKFIVGDIVRFDSRHCDDDKYPYLKIIDVDCQNRRYVVANLEVPSYHFHVGFDQDLTLVSSPCRNNFCQCVRCNG